MSRESIAAILGIDLTDPVMLQALADARARRDRAVTYTCAWGTCVAEFDPVERRITGGYGQAFCGCECLPGWRARHPEGRPKPSVPVKARGRHGSRVQRSRARRREWLSLMRDLEERP